MMDINERDLMLENVLKDNPVEEVPQEVDIRLRRHLTTLRTLMAVQESKKQSPRIFNRSMVLRCTMSVAALGLFIFVSYMVISGGTFTLVYANAVKQLRKAHTVTYTSIYQYKDPASGIGTTEHEVIFKMPYYYRYSYPDGSFNIQNIGEHKDLFVSPAGKQYIETISYNDQNGFNGRAVINEMRLFPIWAKKIPGEQEMDGHIVRGFRTIKKSYIKTFWIDTETYDLVEMETEYLNSGNRLIIKDIRFDIVYPDDIFNFNPPPGYTVIKRTRDASPACEQDLINALDILTSYNVNSLFPESWDYNNMSRYLSEFFRSGRLGTTDEEITKTSALLNRGNDFVLFLEPGTWHYAGQGVKRGAADTPVFWYKPDRPFWISLFSKTSFRVIYADLTVQDVYPEDLPIVPGKQSGLPDARKYN